MAKSRVLFVCSNCGTSFSAWSGRCSNCGEWNTLIEQLSETSGSQLSSSGRPLKSQSLKDSVARDEGRLVSGNPEIDNVFGGGIVPGSINLIAGQPGIGKSTMLLQLAAQLAKSVIVLYISGEESEHQIALRASRLKISQPALKLATTNSADDIAATITEGSFKLVIIDSIQTMACRDIPSAPGSVSQITNSTNLISMAAKKNATAVILVGHVTKEGMIAGPKVLEHLVDSVLQLEGDRVGGLKILRSIKNRYGPTNESGIFEMTDKGLEVVANPSAALLAERQVSDGSVVLATIEGSRPILVEIQALVSRTNFGYPKRTASGFDLTRLNLLLAMLERRTKLSLSSLDVYINSVGGIDVREPAADLAICMAIASASKGYQLKKNAVVFGEVGLSGEVRHIPFIEKRYAEAVKLGFEAVIGPKIPKELKAKLKNYQEVKDVKSALNQFLEK